MQSTRQLDKLIDQICFDTTRLTTTTIERLAVCRSTLSQDAEIKAASEDAIAASRERLEQPRR